MTCRGRCVRRVTCKELMALEAELTNACFKIMDLELCGKFSRKSCDDCPLQKAETWIALLLDPEGKGKA